MPKPVNERVAALEATGRAHDIRHGDLQKQLDGRVKLLQDEIDRRMLAMLRETEAYKDDIAGRFNTVNEFRGSLDDLGKNMATRRELEAGVGGLQNSVTLLQNALSDLRTQVAVGPPTLHQLQARADEVSGARRKGAEFTATTIAVITTGTILFVGILSAVITIWINKG